MSERRIRTVGILIFDDVEVLDFCGPFEVFSVARPAGEDADDARLFRALTIAPEARLVTCRGGLLVQPHHSIADHPPLDILVVPGGQGTRRERANARLLDWIAAQDRDVELTTSVCTGAFLLADARVVDEGHVITSAGVAAGIDMALHVVARLHGEETAAWTARRMEYDRTPTGRVPTTP